ncbi:MAG: hypothetical protein ABJL44_08440 [Algibacter sp.]
MKRITPQNIIFLKPVYVLFVLIPALVFSCASKKEVPKTNTSLEINPKLIFLNYTISKGIDGLKTVDFISKTIVDGKARNSSNKYIKTGQVGDLKCTQLDNKSQILRSVFIKNPLNKIIEFVNDSLQLESKSLKLNKAPLSLRLQLHAETKQIRIAEVIDSLYNTKPLSITKLETK